MTTFLVIPLCAAVALAFEYLILLWYRNTDSRLERGFYGLMLLANPLGIALFLRMLKL